ncbi:myosin-14-like [Phalacrocorax carbo]|uniref:myosin-14-like n=1 Tax=Phalacrocorax carbo TaxID=9209 RepID=UPI003119CE5B
MSLDVWVPWGVGGRCAPWVEPGGRRCPGARVLPCPRLGWHREFPAPGRTPGSHGPGLGIAPAAGPPHFVPWWTRGTRDDAAPPGWCRHSPARTWRRSSVTSATRWHRWGGAWQRSGGRSLAAGGALRALQVAVGGAQARVGGACRARDRACERLRQQQEAGHLLWAELEAARAARAGAELRAQEAESQRRTREAELEQLRQAVAVAQHARRRAEQERNDMAAHVPHPPSPTGARDPGGLEAALAELREHNRALRQRLHQRQAQAEELRRALAAAGARAQEAAGARARLEQEQRVLRGRLQHPRVLPGPAEAALRARCVHLQELLHREAGGRAALSRAWRAAGRRLRALLAEAEEQRLRGERYRLQAAASEASGRALGQRVAAVAAGAARAQAQGLRLRRALEAVGDGAAATARLVAALRARLRCDPLTLSRTVRRMLRDEGEDSEDSEDSGDSGSPPLHPQGAPRNRPRLQGRPRNCPQGPPPKGCWSWGWPGNHPRPRGDPQKRRWGPALRVLSGPGRPWKLPPGTPPLSRVGLIRAGLIGAGLIGAGLAHTH